MSIQLYPSDKSLGDCLTRILGGGDNREGLAQYLALALQQFGAGTSGGGGGTGGAGAAMLNFTTTEQDTGSKWVTGQKVYQKTVACGAGGNSVSTPKLVAHGIANLDTVIRTFGYGNSGSYQIPIPHSDSQSLGNQWGIWVDATNLNLLGNQTAMTSTYVTILYTCTNR